MKTTQENKFDKTMKLLTALALLLAGFLISTSNAHAQVTGVHAANGFGSNSILGREFYEIKTGWDGQASHTWEYLVNTGTLSNRGMNGAPSPWERGISFFVGGSEAMRLTGALYIYRDVHISKNFNTNALSVGKSGVRGFATIWGTNRGSVFNFSNSEDTYIRGGKTTSNVYINDDGGNVAIRQAKADATLDVARGTANGGTAMFRGTTHWSHFNYSTAEHTYIRGGLSSSNVILNDVGRYVAVGHASPTATLDVARRAGNNGTALFRGTQHSSHFNVGQNEDTYLRGGKDAANVFINDIGGGNVGIGHSAATEKLDVKGKIKADGVILNIGSFPDYVFSKDYELLSLREIEAYIHANQRLPKMPSEKEVIKNGMAIGQINVLLVEKVEELTLHTIAQEKEIEAQRASHALQAREIAELKAALNEIRAKLK